MKNIIKTIFERNSAAQAVCFAHSVAPFCRAMIGWWYKRMDNVWFFVVNCNNFHRIFKCVNHWEYDATENHNVRKQHLSWRCFCIMYIYMRSSVQIDRSMWCGETKQSADGSPIVWCLVYVYDGLVCYVSVSVLCCVRSRACIESKKICLPASTATLN